MMAAKIFEAQTLFIWIALRSTSNRRRGVRQNCQHACPHQHLCWGSRTGFSPIFSIHFKINSTSSRSL
ncbi:MAG TPA: hypothetical protein VIM99_06165, partial [Blastocatellia bacterium]